MLHAFAHHWAVMSDICTCAAIHKLHGHGICVNALYEDASKLHGLVTYKLLRRQAQARSSASHSGMVQGTALGVYMTVQSRHWNTL